MLNGAGRFRDREKEALAEAQKVNVFLRKLSSFFLFWGVYGLDVFP